MKYNRRLFLQRIGLGSLFAGLTWKCTEPESEYEYAKGCIVKEVSYSFPRDKVQLSYNNESTFGVGPPVDCLPEPRTLWTN